MNLFDKGFVESKISLTYIKNTSFLQTNYYFNGKLWTIINVTFVEMKKTIFITLLHVLFWKRFGEKYNRGLYFAMKQWII
jgi:hypothetical protein